MRITILPSVAVLIVGFSIARCESAVDGPATRPVNVVAPAATRPAEAPKILRFNEKSIKAILAGTKTISIREGAREFPDSTVKAVGSSGTVVMLTDVTTVQKKVSELTAEDAKANGSTSLEDLQAEMLKNYPGIKGVDLVTVIKFRHV
jgi:hypothetical protein